MLTTTIRASLFSGVVMALFGISPMQAQLVFDNGGSNTVDTLVNDYIYVFDDFGGNPTTVTFNTGAIITGTDLEDDTVFVAESSMVIINDGSFTNDVTAVDDASISIFSGILNDDLFAFDFATVTMSGGVVVDDITAVGPSTVNLLGGSYGEDIEADFGAVVTISGGQIAANGVGTLNIGLGVDADAAIILQGTSFLVNGLAVGAGDVVPVTGTISGTLADGSTFSNVPFDRDPSGGTDQGTINIVIIPEPASSSLLGLGGFALLWYRKRRR